jgi:hypothetical protein
MINDTVLKQMAAVNATVSRGNHIWRYAHISRKGTSGPTFRPAGVLFIAR